ncbi:MAG: hypothetical protein ABSB94_16885 [Syntrophorhabdales bacterium]|jgi:DNA-binding transcriptional MerR regulator
MRLYKQGEVQKIFPDVPGKTLIYWAREGLVEWDAKTKDARGIHREYSLWNLYQIGILRELTAVGLPYAIVRLVMDTHFKDSRWHSDPALDYPHYKGPYMETVLRIRPVKPSQSEIMKKMLVLTKYTVGRVDHITGEIVDRPLSEFMNDFDYPCRVFFNLPAIVQQVEKSVKNAGLR